MNSLEIRQKFLAYFEKHGHTVVPSSSLIPADDPTLLFANAGMNQFKDLFLGSAKRGYTRATSSQKCVRAGGKHNDLDEVGFTNRHLTFFEMLGNFSFGDYFKKDAIIFAWNFLTKEVGLDGEHLVVSVYKTDDEAYDLWHKEIGVPESRIYRLGEKDNFWQMGDTGPCGPCTEIHLDNGGNHDCDPSCSCGRFVEIWNLVFMQYDRQQDGTLRPLKQTGVDTGMGLERLCMVMQKKESIFRSDLFDYLIKRVEELTGVDYDKSSPDLQAAFHVLADHVRSSSLLIADGCAPSNEGRGYVLRKIIRRAALFARKLTSDTALFPLLAETFIDAMHPVFTNLTESKKLILELLKNEIERFAVSLDQGEQIFQKYIALNKKEGKKIVDGSQIFKLYDTYGFPPELTRVMALEHSFELDMDGFEREMKKQRAQSGKKDGHKDTGPAVPAGTDTTFVGYDVREVKAKVLFAHHEEDSLWIVTEESPFYVESGGQVGDHGWVTIDSHVYRVGALSKGVGERPAILVRLVVDDGAREKAGKVKAGDMADCSVDLYKRESSEKNHTATHLLQAALVQVLGSHVKQAGSLVCEDHLRFDFSHHQAMSKEQVAQVEQIVNQKIQENIVVETFCTSLQEAQEAGVKAFFGEKYNSERVRVVRVAGFSAELCGGTHVERTGAIGCLKIVSEGALSTGVRRLVALTGSAALKSYQSAFNTVKALSEQFKAKPEALVALISANQTKYLDLSRELKQVRKDLINAMAPVWAQSIEPVASVPLLFLATKGYDVSELKLVGEAIEKHAPGFYFLISEGDEGRVSFVCSVSASIAGSFDLRALGKALKEKMSLRGGGKPNLIQGGGSVKSIDEVRQFVREWISRNE